MLRFELSNRVLRNQHADGILRSLSGLLQCCDGTKSRISADQHSGVQRHCRDGQIVSDIRGQVMLPIPGSHPIHCCSATHEHDRWPQGLAIVQ